LFQPELRSEFFPTFSLFQRNHETEIGEVIGLI